jgi:aspartate-semialdehyde dehydrogenase
LQNELSHVFSNSFPVNCVATRVPVWRGHTISLTLKLADAAKAVSATETLSNHSRISLLDRDTYYPRPRQEIEATDQLCTIEGIRDGQDGWITMSLRGDNLEAATTGLMLEVASML